MAAVELYSQLIFVVLIQLPTLITSFEENPQLVNIHLLFVPEKEMNTLKSLGVDDPNQWKLFRTQENVHWEALHLPGGKAQTFEVKINSNSGNRSRIQYRQFEIGGGEKGLELMLKDVPVNHDKEGKESSFNNDEVRFFKDCSKFLGNSSDTKPKPKTATVESNRIVDAYSDSDMEPLLLPYDSKFLSNLKTTVIKYIPYRNDGTLRLSRLKKIKRKEVPLKDPTNNGCIEINLESVVRALQDAQARYPKQILFKTDKQTGSTISPNLQNGKVFNERINRFKSLVRLLGLKIPNDTESVNKTLVQDMLSSQNKTAKLNNALNFQIPKVFHPPTSKTTFSQDTLKNVLKQISEEPRKEDKKISNIFVSDFVADDNNGHMVNRKSSDDNKVDKVLATSDVNTNNLRNLKHKNIAKENEEKLLKVNLAKLLGDQEERKHRRHQRYFRHRRHHHPRHRRRHHRNRFKKLHLLVSNNVQPLINEFPTRLNKNPMRNILMDNDDENQFSQNKFNDPLTTDVSLHHHGNRFESFDYPEQDKDDHIDYERMQDHTADQSQSDGVGLKLDPNSYSSSITFNDPSPNAMFSPKLGIPDLKPYLHNEFDKETKEADDLSNQYNDADMTEAKRLSRFEEDRILRQAFGLGQEGHTTVGARQEDSPVVTGSQQEEEGFKERFQQGLPHMGGFQDQNPSMFNEAPVKWNKRRENANIYYGNNLASLDELNSINQENPRFQNRKFPAMVSAYNSAHSVFRSPDMNTADEDMPIERGFARNGLGPSGISNPVESFTQTAQYPYVGNMQLSSFPFTMESQVPQFNGFAAPEEPQANMFSPFQMGTNSQLVQGSPFPYVTKKKKKRSKTAKPRSSRQKARVSA